MANSNWSFDAFKRPEHTPSAPSDRAVPVEPRQDRIPEQPPVDGYAALQELFDAHQRDKAEAFAEYVREFYSSAAPAAPAVPAGAYFDAIDAGLQGDKFTFTPIAELAAEGLVDIFVNELDILDCPVCFTQHFKLGEKCRKHDA